MERIYISDAKKKSADPNLKEKWKLFIEFLRNSVSYYLFI